MTNDYIPYDSHAEREVLGVILHDPDDALAELAATCPLQASDFFVPEHRLIADAIYQLDAEGRAITEMSIASYLETENQLESIGGIEFIQSLRRYAGNLEDAANRILARTMRRSMINAGALIIAKARQENISEDDLMFQAEDELMKIRQRQQHNVLTIGDMLNLFGETFERRLAGETVGFRTNFHPFDATVGIMNPTDFGLLAGRPGDGKSAWLRWLVYHTTIRPPQGVPAIGAYIGNFEEDPASFAMKLVAIHTGFSTRILKDPQQMSEGQIQRVYEAVEFIKGAPLYVDSMAGVTPSRYRSRLMAAQRLCLREFGVPIGFHSPDYIQRMRGEGATDTAKNTYVSNAVRDICMELQIPAIATAQLSRAPIGQNGQPRPYTMSDLRDSGSYEQDATMIAFIRREWMIRAPDERRIRAFPQNVDRNNNIIPEWQVEPIRLDIAKNRDTGTGHTRTLEWHRYCGRFVESERV